MGYRSNVSLVIEFENTDALDKYMVAAPLRDGRGWDAMFKHYCTYNRDTNTIQCLWEDVKWYEGYNDVEAVNALVEFANSAFDAATWMVRIGEDYHDMEEDYNNSENWSNNLYEHMTIHRYTEFDDETGDTIC